MYLLELTIFQNFSNGIKMSSNDFYNHGTSKALKLLRRKELLIMKEIEKTL